MLGFHGLFCRPRKQPLIWLSWHWREHFVKKLYKSHLVFSFISLSLLLRLTSFFCLGCCQRFFTLIVILIPPQACILTPLWDLSLETRKLTWVGLHSQIWSPHPGSIPFYFWDFFSIGVVFIYVHFLGCVVVTLVIWFRHLVLQVELVLKV